VTRLALIALALAGCASSSGGHLPPQPAALGWPDGAYVADVLGKSMPLYVDGADVSCAGYDLDCAWEYQRGRGWVYAGEFDPPGAIHRVRVALRPDLHVWVEFGSFIIGTKAEPVKGNG
jgi:hypothetical protein